MKVGEQTHRDGCKHPSASGHRSQRLNQVFFCVCFLPCARKEGEKEKKLGRETEHTYALKQPATTEERIHRRFLVSAPRTHRQRKEKKKY